MDRQHVSDAALERIQKSDRPLLVTEGSGSVFARMGLVVLTQDEIASLREQLAAEKAEVWRKTEQLAEDHQRLLAALAELERLRKPDDPEVTALEAEYKERQRLAALLLQSPAFEPIKLGRGPCVMERGV